MKDNMKDFLNDLADLMERHQAEFVIHKEYDHMEVTLDIEVGNQTTIESDYVELEESYIDVDYLRGLVKENE